MVGILQIEQSLNKKNDLTMINLYFVNDAQGYKEQQSWAEAVALRQHKGF